MTGLYSIPILLAAAQSDVSGAPDGLSAGQFLLLFVAAGFLLYVFAGHRQPSRVVAGLICIGAAAAVCGAFLFLPVRDEQQPATATVAPDDSSDSHTATVIKPPSPTDKADLAGDALPAVSNKTSEPLDAGTISGSRPVWLDQPPTGLADGVYQEVVSSGQYATWRECQRALDRKMYEAVMDFLNRYRGTPEYPGIPEFPLSRGFVERRILKETYTEQLQSPRAGEMYEMHALLRFDAGVREELQTSLLAYHEQTLERDRLLGVGGLAGLLLAFVAAIYGYLKIDTATKGYYSGRLKLALAGVTVGVVIGAVTLFDFCPLGRPVNFGVATRK